jgi:eukaryotic-like serine/threonine-protein kinase
LSLAALFPALHDGEVQELAAGTLRGHYRITRRLGQGGMGVVYEAEDQKLGRLVAIKLLPEAICRDPVALERFWREARTASSLNHPGICTIHELNQSGDQPFIVMERLEGESLDRLYHRRSMPYPKLLDFGVQAADALDAAHKKGILHRDIKPGNIFLSPSGQVKILDFGLAKMVESETHSDNDGNANVTESYDVLTRPGAVFGTTAYMSPEQARGEALDARSDIFSLGVVLYELATGHHPFRGSTTAVTVDHLLNHAPTAPISLNPDLPLEFEETLNKTLEKDRDLRLQSAAELRADLKRLQRKSSAGSASPPIGAAADGIAGGSVSPLTPSRVVRKSRALPIALLVLVLLAAACFAAWRLWPRAVPFTSIAVSQITNTGTLEHVAISRNGKFLAEVKNDADQRTLWIRNIATNTDTQILGPVSSAYGGLSFSPDSDYLYFIRSTPDNSTVGSLFMMPVFGGTPRQLIHGIDRGPSLSPDGLHFVYMVWTPGHPDRYSEIHIADKSGANDEVVYTTLDEAEAPAWSPQPNKIAWIEFIDTGPTAGVIKILDIASKRTVSIAEPSGILYDRQYRSSDLAWLPDGKHLLVLYSKSRGYSDRQQIGIVTVPKGDFHELTNDVSIYSQLAISADGKTLATVLTEVDSSLAYYKGDGGTMISSTPLRTNPTSLAWADEDHLWLNTRDLGISKLDRVTGTLQPIETGDLDIGAYDASINTCPDGHVLFIARPGVGGESRLFRMDGDGAAISQLTTTGDAWRPFCTPDSQKVYFTIAPRENISKHSLWSVPLSGGTPQLEYEFNDIVPLVLTPDTKVAGALVHANEAYSMQIWDLSTHQMVHQLPWDASSLWNGFPAFSPDGKAIVSPITFKGSYQLKYQPIDGSPSHPMTEPTHDAQTAFAWSPSGSKLAVLQLRSNSDVVLIKDLATSGVRRK